MSERRTELWPIDTPCYKCHNPVGEPWGGKLVPRRPVCPVCAWENIQAALDSSWDDDPVPRCPECSGTGNTEGIPMPGGAWHDCPLCRPETKESAQ